MSEISTHAIFLPPPIGSLSTRGAMRKIATATSAATAALWTVPNIVPVSSTNATPVVVTVATGHGFVTGDRVTVANHTTNTGANGTWTLGTVGATTLQLLGSVGNGVGGATGTINFADPLLLVPETQVWVAFEVLTADCYIRIGTAQTAGTTADNGLLLKVGAPPAQFFLTPSKHTNVDTLSVGGAGVLKWYVASPPGARERV